MQRSVSIAFQTDKPIAAYGSLAKTVKDFGFSGVSVYNAMPYQPAWLPLLELASHTTRIRIGPAAVNPFPYRPINIAGSDEMGGSPMMNFGPNFCVCIRGGIQ